MYGSGFIPTSGSAASTPTVPRAKVKSCRLTGRSSSVTRATDPAPRMPARIHAAGTSSNDNSSPSATESGAATSQRFMWGIVVPGWNLLQG